MQTHHGNDGSQIAVGVYEIHMNAFTWSGGKYIMQEDIEILKAFQGRSTFLLSLFAQNPHKLLDLDSTDLDRLCLKPEKMLPWQVEMLRACLSPVPVY